MKRPIYRSAYAEVIFAAALFAVSLGVNYLFIGNGSRVAAVSDKYETIITPPPFTFSIWGLIYSLGAAALAVWFRYAAKNKGQFLEQLYAIRYLILITVLNSLWIVCWVNQLIPAAWMLIVGMAALFFFHERTRRSHGLYKQSVFSSIPEVFFGLYYGWITVAAVLNTLVLLRYAGLTVYGSADVLAPLLVLLLAAAAFAMARAGNAAYGLAVLWASVGIYVHRHSRYGGSLSTLLILLLVLGLGAALIFFMYRSFKASHPR